MLQAIFTLNLQEGPKDSGCWDGGLGFAILMLVASLGFIAKVIQQDSIQQYSSSISRLAILAGSSCETPCGAQTQQVPTSIPNKKHRA